MTIDEESTLSALRAKLLGEYSEEKADSAKERRKMKQELHEIELRTEALYENKVSGLISAERFSELVAVSEERRKELKNRLSAFEQAEKSMKAKLDDIERWASLIKENASITEVDRDLIDAQLIKLRLAKKQRKTVLCHRN